MPKSGTMRAQSRSAVAVVAALLAMLAATAVALLSSGSASAVTPNVAATPYTPKTCATISVSSTIPAVGQTITIAGEDFKANTAVTVTLQPFGATLKKLTTSKAGTFSFRIKLPVGARGHQIIRAEGAGVYCPPDPLQITIGGGTAPINTSTDPGAGGGGGGNGGDSGGNGLLPGNTGVDVAILLALAAALVAAGVAFTRGGRRARRA